MSASEVASHYNRVRNVGIKERESSKIYHLRNMNNWMKSMLINEALEILRKESLQGRLTPIRVLDLACGKGGDLRKWNKKGSGIRINSVVMTDIAEVSVEQAKERYAEMRERQRGQIFDAQFIVADSCKDELVSKIDPAFNPIDLVSCQFALHYSFIEEEAARCFIRNATASIRPGGLFIGTLPDAERIVWAARSSENGKWSNRICRISYDRASSSLAAPPLFGASFHFQLDEQVDCPEFLVYFPLLVKLLEEEGMEVVMARRFPEAAKQWMQGEAGRILAEMMKGLEEMPRSRDVERKRRTEEPVAVQAKRKKKEDENQKEEKKKEGEEEKGNEERIKEEEKKDEMKEEEKGEVEEDSVSEEEYLHVKEGEKVGTLSLSEWQAFSMYMVFIFRKRDILEKAPLEEEVKKQQSECDVNEPSSAS